MQCCGDGYGTYMSELRLARNMITLHEYRNLEAMIMAGRGGQAMRELTALIQKYAQPWWKGMRQGRKECGGK